VSSRRRCTTLLRRAGVLLVLALMCLALGSEALAKDFYAGKTVSLYIGYSVGGGYDLYGRLVARHLGRHLPGNPTVVPINMEGAGSLKLMNWLYNAAPKDGTVLGTVNQSAPFVPLVGERALARYDATKFTWLGSANEEVSVCVAWKRTGITHFDELYTKELIVGSTGAGADEFTLHALVRHILGARLRSVVGYPGGNEMNFAMERGEVDGRCGWAWSSVKSTRQKWLDDGMIHVLLQFGLRKHPDLPDVPLIMDLAKSEEERQILRLVMMAGLFGRPFLAPPGIPAPQAEALAAAFDATIADPKFRAEAKQMHAEITPVTAATLRQYLTEAYATSPHLVERARILLK
jgi:tripartite-type tricarboxylate transporter receptor subunit TctC